MRAELSVALVPTAMGTGSSPVEALMFREGEYVDKATATGVGYLAFNRDKTTGDTVVLIFRATMGSCGGCDDGTYDDVRFQWRNGKVVALDPIPRLMGSSSAHHSPRRILERDASAPESRTGSDDRESLV